MDFRFWLTPERAPVYSGDCMDVGLGFYAVGSTDSFLGDLLHVEDE